MYAYPPQMYVKPPEPKTPSGVKWTVVALAIYLPFLIVSILFAIYAYTLLSNLQPGDITQLLNSLALLLLSTVITAILGILVLVFYFIGFGYMYGGRNEMGPAHARNLRIALPLLIVAFSVDLAGRVVSYLISSSAFSFDFFSGQITFDPNALYLGVAVSTTVGVFVAAMIAAVLVLSIRALAKPSHNLLLYLAAGIGTATPGIAGALALLQLPTLVRAIQDFIDQGPGGFFFSPPNLDPSLGIPSVVMGSLGLLTAILYFVVYRGASFRLVTGELKPVLPPAAQAPSWMPPMMPYAAPPAPPAAPPMPPPAPAEPPAQPPA